MKKQTERSSKKAPRHHRAFHRARLVIVPHAYNAYRPHLIRWQGIALGLLLVASLQFAYNLSNTGNVLGQGTNVSAERLLRATNQQRKDAGTTALRLNEKLNQAAALKAADMFEHQYWAHVSPSGVSPWTWIRQSDYRYSVAGENLAKNFQTANGVVRAWMNSPEHRANMVNDAYQDVGFAVRPGTINGETTTLVVALYGSQERTNQATPTVLAANHSQSPVGRVGTWAQSLDPSIIGSVLLLFFMAAVALAAHQYRHKLPRDWRMSWRRYHGLYKAIGTASVAISLLVLYGGGQI